MNKDEIEKRIVQYEEEINKIKEKISFSEDEREKVKLNQLLMFMQRGINTFKKVNGV
jgi:ABC-type Fe3+-citrate transport system substrate-binding protein